MAAGPSSGTGEAKRPLLPPQKIWCGFEGSGARKCEQRHPSHSADPTQLVAGACWDPSFEGCTNFNVNIVP